jgi:hypothetical protein
MRIPASVRSGDTTRWQEDAFTGNLGEAISSTTHDLTFYIRGSAAEGATIAGSANGSGWLFAFTPALTAGNYYWQAVAENQSTGDKTTAGAGQIEILANLSYTGDPSVFDGRSQAQQDLDAVQLAIRSLISKGAKQYSIGGRSYTAQDLTQLMEREAQLKAIVARERAAEKVAQGLGDGMNLFVRF